jgi:hypothetical protein
MEIQVKTKHFRESKGYSSIRSCPLALAIHDVVEEGTPVSVGGHSVTIGEKNYNIGENWMDPDIINQMVYDAKEGNEIETVTVVLTED